jgi:hypothetical protein
MISAMRQLVGPSKIAPHDIIHMPAEFAGNSDPVHLLRNIDVMPSAVVWLRVRRHAVILLEACDDALTKVCRKHLLINLNVLRHRGGTTNGFVNYRIHGLEGDYYYLTDLFTILFIAHQPAIDLWLVSARN